MGTATPREILEAADRVFGASPMTLTEVIAAVTDAGVELGPNARAEVIDGLQHGSAYVELAGDRWLALDRALNGTTWSTVADADVAAMDCLATTPDLELVHWWAIEDGVPFRGFGANGTDSMALLLVEELDDGRDALVGPEGWLTDYAGAPIAVAVRDGACSIEPLDVLPQPSDELVQLLRTTFDTHVLHRELERGEVDEPIDVAWMTIDELLCEAIAAYRGLFTARVIPRLDDVLEGARLQRRLGMVIDASASWDDVDRLLDRDDLAEQWDLDDDELDEAEMLIAASYGVMSGALDLDTFGEDDEDAPPTEDDGEAMTGAAAASFLLALCLVKENVARAFLGHHIEHETDPADLAEFARELLEYLDAPEDTGVRWLLAWALDQQGEALAAEAELERALRSGVDHVPALCVLAGFRADRGDAPGAMALLERAVRQEVGNLDDPDSVDIDRDVELLVEEVEDYVGTERYPLLERGPWLYEKARRFLQTRPAHLILTRLAALTTDAAYGDTAMFVALLDTPLLADVALHEAGVFADFVRERDALLPDDEALTAAQWALTDRSLFEIVDIGDGHVAVRDLRTGDDLTVTNVTPSPQSRRGSLLLGRPLPIADTWRALSGFVDVSAECRDEALELLRDDPDPFEIATFLGRCLVDRTGTGAAST